jgi:hypothetical protein
LFHPNAAENSGEIVLIEAAVRRVRVKAGALPGINAAAASTILDLQKF